MKNRDSWFVIRGCVLSLLLISACSNEPANVLVTPKPTSYPDGKYEQPSDHKAKVIPPSAYYNRGEPENLLDGSVEMVNVSLATRADLRDLASMIEQDPPTRAEMACSGPLCMQARDTLGAHGVPTQFSDRGGDVTLFYERVMARDCQNRYVENRNDKYMLSPPTFGCSVTANTVQAVSDKRQITNPRLLDFQDGSKAAQTYGRYSQPTVPEKGNANNSLLQNIPISGSGR